MIKRCGWCTNDPLYIDYHDKEWGVPVHDEQHLFEFLILEGAQAGLSWITVLKKRERYRQCFANFEPEAVSRFSDQQLDALLLDSGLIRNRLKIYAARQNAQAFLQIQAEYGSFDQFIWQFVDGQPLQHHRENLQSIPPTTVISDTMSKELKRRGFTFVGSTICYAFMQAMGLVNDHVIHCFRYQELVK